MNVNIITRSQWNARKPVYVTPLLKIPVTNIFCCFSGTIECHNIKKCAVQVKRLQKFHIYMKNLGDIQYNFLVGCDGNVYEGRGWMHTATIKEIAELNASSIIVAVLGIFKDRKPPDIVFEVLQEFINFGIKNNLIVKDFKTHLAFTK